jgi:hypothetical protein
MSILSLDTPPWQVIVKHLSSVDIINVANTHPRLRNHIRKLASTIMRQKYPYMYSATEPFLRLLGSQKFSHFTSRLWYGTTEAAFDVLKHRLESYDGLHTGPVPTLKHPLADYSPLKNRWHMHGQIPPRGTTVHLCVAGGMIEPFMNIEDAIEWYLSRHYNANVNDILNWYKKYTGRDVTIDDEDLQLRMRQYAGTIVPYTRANVAACMRACGHAWGLDECDEDSSGWLFTITI